jgi:DNA-binding NarL/FixJ family response regulator
MSTVWRRDMNETDLARVEEELSVIIRLLAKLLFSSVLEPDASQQDQIGVLSAAGLQNKHIAEILGTSPGTVSNALTRLRKRKK